MELQEGNSWYFQSYFLLSPLNIQPGQEFPANYLVKWSISFSILGVSLFSVNITLSRLYNKYSFYSTVHCKAIKATIWRVWEQ